MASASPRTGADGSAGASTPAAPSGTPLPRAGASRVDQSTLATSYAALPDGLGERSGLAVVAVGGGEPLVLGGLRTGAAWSTSKVPLVIAALDGAQATAPARAAIINSDNAAAETLWQELGGGSRAAGAVDRELRALGDTHTVTQARRVRPPYTAFGQTQWALDDAATFSAHLPCDARARATHRLMGEVDAGQQWGIARLAGAHLKGGWGPSAGGTGYLVRQLGTAEAPGGGRWGLAVVVEAPAGFGQGTADLDRITAWVQDHARELPAGGSCQG